MLTKAQIDTNGRLMACFSGRKLSNFEQRMIAEVELYWIIYENTSGVHGRQHTRNALVIWKVRWQDLLGKSRHINLALHQVTKTPTDQSRSQFMQMGYNFAHLLVICQSNKLTSRRIVNADLRALVDGTEEILNLAMNTTDARTQHLTDHIYHVITFSAITLCRLLSTYENTLLEPLAYDVAGLDGLVTRLITWLKSIGPRSHVAHMLGSVVASQQKKLRPQACMQVHDNSVIDSRLRDDGDSGAQSVESLPFDTALLYPDFIQADLFDYSADDLWPTWDP